MNKTTHKYTTPVYKRWEVIRRYGGNRYGAEVQRSTAGRSLRLRVRAYKQYGQWEDWPLDCGPGIILADHPDEISIQQMRPIRMAFCFIEGYTMGNNAAWGKILTDNAARSMGE